MSLINRSLRTAATSLLLFALLAIPIAQIKAQPDAGTETSEESAGFSCKDSPFVSSKDREQEWERAQVIGDRSCYDIRDQMTKDANRAAKEELTQAQADRQMTCDQFGSCSPTPNTNSDLSAPDLQGGANSDLSAPSLDSTFNSDLSAPDLQNGINSDLSAPSLTDSATLDAFDSTQFGTIDTLPGAPQNVSVADQVLSVAAQPRFLPNGTTLSSGSALLSPSLANSLVLSGLQILPEFINTNTNTNDDLARYVSMAIALALVQEIIENLNQ